MIAKLLVARTLVAAIALGGDPVVLLRATRLDNGPDLQQQLNSVLSAFDVPYTSEEVASIAGTSLEQVLPQLSKEIRQEMRDEYCCPLELHIGEQHLVLDVMVSCVEAGSRPHQLSCAVLRGGTGNAEPCYIRLDSTAKLVAAPAPAAHHRFQVVVTATHLLTLRRDTLALVQSTVGEDVFGDLPIELASNTLMPSSFSGAALLPGARCLLIVAAMTGVLLVEVDDTGHAWARDTIAWPHSMPGAVASLATLPSAVAIKRQFEDEAHVSVLDVEASPVQALGPSGGLSREKRFKLQHRVDGPIALNAELFADGSFLVAGEPGPGPLRADPDLVTAAHSWRVYRDGRAVHLSGRKIDLPMELVFAVVPEKGPWLLQDSAHIWYSFDTQLKSCPPIDGLPIAGPGPYATALVLQPGQAHVLATDLNVWSTMLNEKPLFLNCGSLLTQRAEHLIVHTRQRLDPSEPPVHLNGAVMLGELPIRFAVEPLGEQHQSYANVFQEDQQLTLATRSPISVAALLLACDSCGRDTPLLPVQRDVGQDLAIYVLVLGAICTPELLSIAAEGRTLWTRSSGMSSAATLPLQSCTLIRALRARFLDRFEWVDIEVEDVAANQIWSLRVLRRLKGPKGRPGP